MQWFLIVDKFFPCVKYRYRYSIHLQKTAEKQRLAFLNEAEKCRFFCLSRNSGNLFVVIVPITSSRYSKLMVVRYGTHCTYCMGEGTTCTGTVKLDILGLG